MARKIIGRIQEKQILDKIIASPRAEFVVVMGRRRVGKTFMIYEYLKEQLIFSFSGTYGVTAKQQLTNFFTEYLRYTKGSKATVQPGDWPTAFTYLTDYLKTIQPEPGKKAVVFIDELPWLDTPKSGFIAALEYFWNQHGSKMDHIVLITCGSVASWMDKKLLQSKGGLYNRVTATLQLQPFSLAETAEYCQHLKLKLSPYQITQLYMVMGGIPFYLNGLTAGKSVAQLIDELCFSANGLLASEYQNLYPSLFTNAQNHITLVEALAKHPYGMTRSKLLQQSKLPTGTFARSLDDLVNSGFVKKFAPFQKKEKDSIYRLMDMYTLFYHKFIQGNNSGNGNSWQFMATSAAYTSWCGYAFENICLLHIAQILKKLGISGMYTQTSSWYFKGNETLDGAQIDLLIDRNDGMINLCEVKFSNKEFIMTKDHAQDLRRKIAVFEAATKTRKTILPTLISTYTPMPTLHYQELITATITLDDLFAETTGQRR